MKKTELFFALLLVLMFIYIVISGPTVALRDNVEIEKVAEEVDAIGHEIMGLEEDMIHEEMRQEVILQEVKKR